MRVHVRVCACASAYVCYFLNLGGKCFDSTYVSSYKVRRTFNISHLSILFGISFAGEQNSILQ